MSYQGATTESVTPSIADEIIAAGQRVAARGWVPATSGNLSGRLDAETLLITASGIDKGELTVGDILFAPIFGAPPKGVSAETGLHQAAYRLRPEIGAVVHIHSVAATLVSRRHASAGEIVFEGYEILKAFAGIKTHEVAVRIPIFPNSQDIASLAVDVQARMADYPLSPGFLIAGHGLYAWGAAMTDALRHTEAFDFLFACALAPGGQENE